MLRAELDKDFLALVDADEAAAEAGQREVFVLSRTMGHHGARVIHPTMDHNTRIAVPDLQEMHDEGLIRLQLLDKGRGNLRITGDGHRYAKELRARTAPPGIPSETGVLDWDSEAFPVLQAVYRAYSAAPNPAGVRQEAINDVLDAKRGTSAPTGCWPSSRLLGTSRERWKSTRAGAR